MKLHFFVFIIVLLFSCKKERTFCGLILDDVEQSVSLESEKSENQNRQNQDCIFDQSIQTDVFLKGIKELEGYTWYDDSKSAEIVLNDHWSLTITRGGCDHFLLSAEFFMIEI